MKVYLPVLTPLMLLLAVVLCFGHGDQEVAEDAGNGGINRILDIQRP